ncbi:hypothetical protein NDU88_005297, partial [Pleurodeles waltl]
SLTLRGDGENQPSSESVYLSSLKSVVLWEGCRRSCQTQEQLHDFAKPYASSHLLLYNDKQVHP